MGFTRNRMDLADQFDWHEMSRRFGEEGEEERLTIFDNGLMRQTKFGVNGVTYAFETDTTDPGVGALKPWTTREKHYDADGNLQKSSVLFDDGVREITHYANGQITSRKLTDHGPDETRSDARDWHSITYENPYFGIGPDLLRKTVVFDDGLVVETEAYGIGGVVSVTTLDQDLDGNPTDTRPWASKSTFSFGGELLSQSFSMDNNVQISWRYEQTFSSSDTFLSSITKYDGEFSRVGPISRTQPGVHDWLWHIETFDQSGARETKEITFDNGDWVKVLYEDGVRSSRLQIASDGSEPWFFRETLFDDEGNADQVIVFETFEKTPAPAVLEFMRDYDLDLRLFEWTLDLI